MSTSFGCQQCHGEIAEIITIHRASRICQKRCCMNANRFVTRLVVVSPSCVFRHASPSVGYRIDARQSCSSFQKDSTVCFTYSTNN